MIIKLNWSGGKDSTAAALLMIEEKCRLERPECYPYRGGKWWSDRMAEGGIL